MVIAIVNMIVDNKQIQKLPIMENQINVDIISLSKSKAASPKTTVNKQEIDKLTIAIVNANAIIILALPIILKTDTGIFIILFFMSGIRKRVGSSVLRIDV